MAYNSTHTGPQIDNAVNIINTALPIANGGTGANTLQGAQDALGITELNSKTTSYEFTTEYSSILAMVNDQVTTKGKTLPFSFVKVLGSSLTDVPSGWGSTEFTGIVDGNGPRLNVSITSYSDGVNNTSTRDIFAGNWITQWHSIDSEIAVMNAELASLGDYDVFFEQVQNNTSHTVPDVNQYRYILVCLSWKESNGSINLLVSHTLPLGVFKALTTNGNGIQVETHDSSRHFAHLMLDSDTSMRIDTGSGMTSNFVFSVYGIK